jgi:hypothetical protein
MRGVAELADGRLPEKAFQGNLASTMFTMSAPANN